MLWFIFGYIFWAVLIVWLFKSISKDSDLLVSEWRQQLEQDLMERAIADRHNN